MLRLPRTLQCLALLSVVATPAGLGAQISFRATAADVGNPLIGGILGAGLVAAVPLGAGGVRLLVGGEYLGGSALRVGSPCAGLVQPGTCLPEPLRDRARSMGGIVGLRVPALRSGHAIVYVGGDAGVSLLQSRTQGLSSGRQLAADKGMWRTDFAAEIEWAPPGSRFGLGGGVALGGLTPVRNVVVFDGYTPLNGAARTLRVWLGVSLGSRRP